MTEASQVREAVARVLDKVVGQLEKVEDKKRKQGQVRASHRGAGRICRTAQRDGQLHQGCRVVAYSSVHSGRESDSG